MVFGAPRNGSGNAIRRGRALQVVKAQSLKHARICVCSPTKPRIRRSPPRW
jgi:hypothetical protein